MRCHLRNDYKSFGYFHLLPECEFNVSEEGKVRHIRLAFLTHELWISLNNT
jgi:hypothetical protein